jgi:hypothetical protein
VGASIAAALRDAGLTVDWDGTPTMVVMTHVLWQRRPQAVRIPSDLVFCVGRAWTSRCTHVVVRMPVHDRAASP